MTQGDIYYGLQDQERLDTSLEDVIERLLEDSDICKIEWPVKVFEHRLIDVTLSAERLGRQALENMLQTLDEEHSDPEGDYTRPTPAMQAAALAFAQAVTSKYVSWACEPTGKVIEVTREEALGL